MRVLSLGAGEQSTAIYLMCATVERAEGGIQK